MFGDKTPQINRFYINIIYTLFFFTLIRNASATIQDFQKHADAKQYLRSINPKKIILDVDAGSDDGMGILLALATEQQEFPEVVAITCTHGNTIVKNVVINVLKTLRIVRKKIPVYIGSQSSFTTTPDVESYDGDDGFGDVPDPDPPSASEAEKEHAALAMVTLVAQQPGEIAIVATGPLSNVALAIKLDPNFRKNLKALYWMGGSVEGRGNIKPGIEFNAFVDPEANFITFNTTGPPVIVLSWETCISHEPISKEWRLNVLGRVNSPYVEFLNAVEAKTLARSPKYAPCDPKLIASVLNPTMITKATIVHIDPSYQGDSRGALMVDYDDEITPKNAVIIQEISAKLFKEMCLKNLS